MWTGFKRLRIGADCDFLIR